MEKNGKRTEGLAKFHNGKTVASEHGLVFSSVSIIDLQPNTTYNLDIRQTLDYPAHSSNHALCQGKIRTSVQCGYSTGS